MQLHQFMDAMGVTPRSLFLHEGRVERLNATRHGLWEGCCWTALRTSAIARPFWGLRRRVVELFSQTDAWAVVLLDGPQTGWALPGAVAQGLMLSGRWHLARDGEYKITPPLPEAFRFASPTQAWAVLMARHSPLVRGAAILKKAA